MNRKASMIKRVAKIAFESYTTRVALTKLGHSFDLTDEDGREFLEYKFRKSPEYNKWLKNQSKRERVWEKEEAIENIEKLSELLTQVGQNHNVWTKNTQQGFLARIYFPGSKKAYLNDSGFLQEPHGTAFYSSQYRKIDKATVQFHRWIESEKVQDERWEKREIAYFKVIEEWIRNNNHTILAGDISNLKLAFNSYTKAYGGYSTHSLPTRNAELVAEAEKEIDRPKYVTEKAEYFEKEKGYDPDYAFPMAWSIYCKYKKPDSPRCKKDSPSEYLKNQGKKPRK